MRLTNGGQYFRDIDATRKAFQNGYFHTGDLAVMYPDGTIYIVDRSKDIIISGGEVSFPYKLYRRNADWRDI